MVPKMEAQKLSKKSGSQNGSPTIVQKKFPKWKPKVWLIKWPAKVWQTFTEQIRTQSITYKFHFLGGRFEDFLFSGVFVVI